MENTKGHSFATKLQTLEELGVQIEHACKDIPLATIQLKVVQSFDTDDAAAIQIRQELLNDETIETEVTDIKSNFGYLPDAIIQLGKSGVELVEQINIMRTIVNKLSAVEGDVGKRVGEKMNKVLIKNDGLFSVDDIGDSEVEYSEMRPRIRHRLPGFTLRLGKTSEKTQPGSYSLARSKWTSVPRKKSILSRLRTFHNIRNIAEGYNLSIFEELDISQRINKYARAMGIINSVMKPSLVQKHTRIRLYNTLARPMLSCVSEAWTLRNADKSRITACEMRFMRRTAGYTK
ncbi:hypothetical protein ANN_12480 [Periplaneta americana]|uniref:Uncharacterized protein n=1 Tax=Periplaneta americana TaxID=6978 RepID=A0ABQ8TGV7_PERAM|nr:hypothetical protein ANN_12480 [Periplaneta americana]